MAERMLQFVRLQQRQPEKREAAERQPDGRKPAAGFHPVSIPNPSTGTRAPRPVRGPAQTAAPPRPRVRPGKSGCTRLANVLLLAPWTGFPTP